jgi:ATPase complex subunit ATP10
VESHWLFVIIDHLLRNQNSYFPLCPCIILAGSRDPNAQCTLVAISCKEFGARLLPSWIDPFEMSLRGSDENDVDRYEVVRITMNEGRIARLLSPFIVSGTKKRVPAADHSNTLLHYGDAEEMRDILRMHNIYTSYVFLLDGIGRVRWAGSGEGSKAEVESMIGIARDLMQPSSTKVAPHQKQASSPRVGKKVPRN